MTLTKKEVKRLRKELENLQKHELPKAQKSLKEAIAEGDGLHDNVLWQRAHEKMNIVINKITEIENKLRTAELVDTTNNISVGIGSEVIIQFEDGKRRNIVVADYVSTERNRISKDSPMGIAVFGKKEGDIVKMKTDVGDKLIQIITIKNSN